MPLPATPDPIVALSWANDGTFLGAYDDVTNSTLGDPGVTIDSGRDGARVLTPPKILSFDFTLWNEDGTYSQERPTSPVYQQVLPGRAVQVQTRHGTQRLYRSHTAYRANVPYRGRALYSLARGIVDDISQTAEIGHRQVEFQCLGLMKQLRGKKITVPIQNDLRTDQALSILLDAAQWPANLRVIDVGSTMLQFWWMDERDCWDAAVELLAAEGPGALYEGPDGSIHFESRNYRATATRSTTTQWTLYDVPGGDRVTYREHRLYRATAPYRGSAPALFFTGLRYEPGFRNIVNRVTVSTKRRALGSADTVVWQYGADLTLGPGETRYLIVKASDPFIGALTPVLTTDYTVAGGTVAMGLTQTSGIVATLQIVSTSGTPTISDLQVRATPLPVVSETIVANSTDTTASKAAFGERTLDISAWPELDPPQAQAICDAWATRYQEVRPQVTISIRNADAEHLRMMLAVQPSDRLDLVEPNTGLSGSVWVESKRLTLSGPGGRVVECELGCERAEALTGAIWDVDFWDNAAATWGA